MFRFVAITRHLVYILSATIMYVVIFFDVFVLTGSIWMKLGGQSDRVEFSVESFQWFRHAALKIDGAFLSGIF